MKKKKLDSIFQWNKAFLKSILMVSVDFNTKSMSILLRAHLWLQYYRTIWQ